MSDKQESKSYISPSTYLPEITLKAVGLGFVLSVLLAGANAYLGLFAGMTVSASIPAAVISMAVLKLFKQSNILENNIVQTAASAGESLAAGVIFTIPALVLIGYWTEFNYWETTLITITGGVLGVLFTVPLRRALIIRQKLSFPEGLATAEVLKTGDSGGNAVKSLAWSAVAGAVMKFAQGGLELWGSVLERGQIFAGRYFTYFGIDVSPALVGVGYIVGLNIATLMFIGGVISWWIAIPIVIFNGGAPAEVSNAIDAGYAIWNSQIRYLGVGAMVVGGVWALINLREAIFTAFQEGVSAFTQSTENKTQNVLRTDKEFSMKWTLIAIAALLVPVFAIYQAEIGLVSISATLSVIMVVAGFLFAAVAGYMAGLVGSSNNPISGVTIATILTASLILVGLMGTEGSAGPAAAIMVGAVVCCAAAIAGDNMQDLKAGYVLGSTPFNQQIMQIVGVVAAALVMAPILTLLNTAYGFGAPTPEHPNALAAPQASLAESVARGVFGGNLPWPMIFGGMAIGVLIILCDLWLEKRKSEFRMPVLAVAIGIYLPFELDSAIFLGGIIAWMVNRGLQSRGKTAEESKGGLLFASGLITGEALMGIILAIPIAVFEGVNMFTTGLSLDGLVGFIPLVGICYWLYLTALKTE